MEAKGYDVRRKRASLAHCHEHVTGGDDIHVAQDIDPATGKPNPAAMARFLETHSESAASAEWAKTAPLTTS